MYKKITILLCIFISIYSNVYCEMPTISEELSNELKLNEIVDELNDYVSEIDLETIITDLVDGNGIQLNGVKKVITSSLKEGITSNLKNVLFILILLILIAIIKSLELESDANITKVANIVAVLIIISIFLGVYSEIITLLKKTVSLNIGIVQVLSPFMMGILILTGAITTTSLLEPIVLLLVSVIGFCVNTVIMPLITISVVFNIITNISDTVNLKKLSGFSNKTALWINGILLAIFLATVGLQTTVSTSVDSITIKTTQAALSGTIPVVR